MTLEQTTAIAEIMGRLLGRGGGQLAWEAITELVRFLRDDNPSFDYGRFES